MLPANSFLSPPPAAQGFQPQVEKPVALILQCTDDHNGILSWPFETSQLDDKYRVVSKKFSNDKEGEDALNEAESLGKIKLLWLRLHASPSLAGTDFSSYDCFLGQSKVFAGFKSLDPSARIIIEGCCTGQPTNLDKFLHKLISYKDLPEGTRNYLKAKKFTIYDNPRRLFYPTNPERTEGLIFAPSFFGVTISRKSTDEDLGHYPSLNVASAIACLIAENRIVFAANTLIQPNNLRFVSIDPLWVTFGSDRTEVLIYDQKVSKIDIKRGGIAFEIRRNRPSNHFEFSQSEIAKKGTYSIGEVIEKARQGIQVSFLKG